MLNKAYYVADDLKGICKSNNNCITITHDFNDERFTIRIYRKYEKVMFEIIRNLPKMQKINKFEMGYLIDESTAKKLKDKGFIFKTANYNELADGLFFKISQYVGVEYYEFLKEFFSENLPLMIKSNSFPALKTPAQPIPNFDDNQYKKMKTFFENRQRLENARLILSRYLQNVHGIILRKHTHSIYKFDMQSNGYNHVPFDDLLMEVSQIINQPINNADLRKALEFMQIRLSPEYDIVKFGNCLYDMNKMEVVENTLPTFTLIETSYDYNPNAESKLMKQYLETLLKKETPELTAESIIGVKEIIGYLFTSGNRLNALPIITGCAGGGKSTFTNILTSIFGQNNVADLKLQELTKNTHATSALLNKHLNLVKDSDDTEISNNSIIKQLTGNDSIDVNPKYQNPYTIPKDEVPKTIVVCNDPPSFSKLENALLQRLLIVEFNEKIRNTEKDNKNLLNEILADENEIEWLIYESLTAYKKMKEEGRDFTLRKKELDTKNLLIKHSNSITYYLKQVISGHDDTQKDLKVKYVGSNELNDIIRYLAKKDHVDIATNDDGIISPKILVQTIRDEFNLDKSYKTKTNAGRRYYPDLIVTDKYLEVKAELESQGP